VNTDELIAILRATDPEPMRLRAENREMRRMLGVLVTWIAEHEDLAAFARGLIEKRDSAASHVVDISEARRRRGTS
jgi:hypothetical protein